MSPTKRAVHVLILGAGPAGLLAAHAAYRLGASVTIISAPGEQDPRQLRKSKLYGCQILPEPVPNYEVEFAAVNIQFFGTTEEYNRKVYGDAALRLDTIGARQSLAGEKTAYDLRELYDKLWFDYVEQRDRANSYPMQLTSLALQADNFPQYKLFDIIISTIPREAICRVPKLHTFFGNDIWIAGDDSANGELAPVTAPPDTIMMSGEKYPSWYRVSNVFGRATVEWPGDVKPPIPYARQVTMPLYTDCDCWPNIAKLGRYGAWDVEQDVLSAYRRANFLVRTLQAAARFEEERHAD